MYMHVSYAECEGLADNENIWCSQTSVAVHAPGIRQAAGTPVATSLKASSSIHSPIVPLA